MEITREDLLRELTFKTSRSGGSGGQHVNKVSSKVELNINIKTSLLFSEDQKRRILHKLSNRISQDGILQVITEEGRSQLFNKERGIDKLIVLLKNALHQPKTRKATRPGKNAVERRLKLKQATALKKISRSRKSWD